MVPISMAIAGSFGPAYEQIDISPLNTVTKTTKKLWEDNKWVTVVFVRLRATPEMIEWCEKYHGCSKYQGAWCHLTSSGLIIMREQTYTHWKLCE